MLYLDQVLKEVYVLYSDFVLKNPSMSTALVRVRVWVRVR